MLLSFSKIKIIIKYKKMLITYLQFCFLNIHYLIKNFLFQFLLKLKSSKSSIALISCARRSRCRSLRAEPISLFDCFPSPPPPYSLVFCGSCTAASWKLHSSGG